MRKRIFKRILAIICIMALVLPMSSEVLAQITSIPKGTKQVFSIVQFHKSSYLNKSAEKDYGYKINNRISYRIFADSDNPEEYSNTILCLDEKGKFPGEDSKDKEYTSQGTADEALGNIRTTKNGSKTPLTPSDIQKIKWLMHNAVLPEDSDQLIDIKLAKIFEKEIKETATTQNPLTLDYIKEILTQDDLVFALQATIWTITNEHDNPVYYGKTREGSQYNSLTGNDVMNERGKQGMYINIIMNYYKEHYLGEDLFPRTSENLEMPTVTVPSKLVFTNTEDPIGADEKHGETSDPYIFVGPFKIEHKSNTADYAIDITFKDENGNRISTGQGQIEFYLKREAKTDAEGLSLTQESLNGEQFYIALHKGTKVRKIEFHLTPMNVTVESETTVWTNNDEAMQPLISVRRTETEINPVDVNYEFRTNYKRKFDVSLRKEIVSVSRKNKLNKWETLDIGDRERQLPGPAKPETEVDKEFNQFSYAHQKAPIRVEVGDIVHYVIRVYNEGMHPVRITKVIDYLPSQSGLELISEDENLGNHTVEYGNYQIEQITKETGEQMIIISSPETGSGICDADLPGRILESDIPEFIEIDLEFRITNIADGRIITNIAEVSEFLGQQDIDGDGNGKGDFLPQEDIDSKPYDIKLPEHDLAWDNYKGNEKNQDDLADDDYYYKGQEDDDDFEKIQVGNITVRDPQVDLALRKSITAQNGQRVDRKRDIDPTPLIQNDIYNNATTSIFSDIKEPPVTAKVGDKIIYTIRVFNEGEQDAYATQITDYIPKGLGFLPFYSDNITNGWKAQENENIRWIKLSEIPNSTNNFASAEFDDRVYSFKDQPVICGNATIETKALENDRIEKFNSDTKRLDIRTVQVTCIVLEPEEGQENIPVRNIAAITGYADENGNPTNKDRDSQPDNDLTNFNENDHQDDEDYEKLITVKEGAEPIYDLALKKFVSAVTDGTNTPKTIADDQKRNLAITSVEQLKQRQDTTTKADAIYSFGLDKEPNPVRIEKGDYVTYTIRIYNEGLTNAKVGEIVDSVPKGLTFITTSAINQKYGWKVFNNRNTQTGWTSGVATTALKDLELKGFDASKENESIYDSNTGTGIDKGVSYAEVKIEFKVNDEAENSVKIKNIAEITKDDGDDNDSTPDNKDPEEDDEDFDVIIPEEPRNFDLSLRKFITKIADEEITDRVPKVDTTELDDGTSTTAKYQHPKEEDIKVVVTGQVVEYTIRVYNEGNESGYASEIKDDIPEGLEFLPEHQTNKDNMWKMYDKDGNETEDVKSAVSIRTNAKSKENGTEKSGGDTSNPYYKSNTNIINAYDPDKMKDGPDYVDVKAAFKVIKETVTDGNTVIINTAEIAKETDENGEEVEDRDSNPDNDKPNEDDIDKEYIKLKYFDLSLLKYVSKVIVTEDGVTKETETGYDGTENPEPVVKVELNKNKLAQTQVKYVYTIKITNEGQIEGYAKEITDRIPEGLVFFAEDNKATGWVEKEAGIITTDYLKDTLLKPGESATVQVVLRWINSETNLGQKVNVAEISVDENEYGIPDIDSTPGNNVDGEDDQDEAIVVLSINTGSAPLYIILITIITAILGTGLYLIYKYVVKR